MTLIKKPVRKVHPKKEKRGTKRSASEAGLSYEYDRLDTINEYLNRITELVSLIRISNPTQQC